MFYSPRVHRRRNFELFNDFFNSYEQKDGDVVADFRPAVNTREGKEAYHIDVDLPGVKKEDISIDIENNTLTISGKRESKSEIKEKGYYKMESSYGKFSRSFSLPKEVDIENIKAITQDGVLEVVIPKLQLEASKTKKIAVE
ncbi:MAG: Hsp20/alpha crystallin family protein [Sulfuricurvum sp.]